jgi:hypothetical protein
MKPATMRVLRVDDLTPTNGMVDLSVDDRTDDRLAEIEAERTSPANAKATRAAISNTQQAIEQARADLVEIEKIINDKSDGSLEALTKRNTALQTRTVLTDRLIKFESQLVKLQAQLAKAQ